MIKKHLTLSPSHPLTFSQGEGSYSRFFSEFPAPVPLYLDGVTLKRYRRESWMQRESLSSILRYIILLL